MLGWKEGGGRVTKFCHNVEDPLVLAVVGWEGWGHSDDNATHAIIAASVKGEVGRSEQTDDNPQILGMQDGDDEEGQVIVAVSVVANQNTRRAKEIDWGESLGNH